MPGIDGLAGRRMLDGSVLQPHLLHPQRLSRSEQRLAVCRNEMRPRPTVKRESVEPQTSVQRVQYAVAPPPELPPAVIHSGLRPAASQRRSELRHARTGSTSL